MRDGAARRAGGSDLELRLLGPLEASRDGVSVALGGPKPRALLAVLALDVGRVVSIDTLVEALWPGDAPETAAHAVQVYVSQLRKSLGGDVLPRRAPGYALELAPDRLDVSRFVRLADDGRAALAAADPEAAASALRDGLALWRGPALADFAYEPFAQTEIARLEELRTVALEERIEADLALGRHAELVSELEALVEASPLRERPRGQLMLALYRSGRQADALAEYRRGREALVTELGIEPGPELKALEGAILRQDESLSLAEEETTRPRMQFRRLVTVLFVDVVDWMALAGALDPEALNRVLQEYFDTVAAVCVRHGGTVEKFAGDAVMAAFGVPVSHEDDALRAARAAVEIRTGLAALNERLEHEHAVRLDARIGIETGEVVAAQTDARQRLITGETVGIASRLEQAAEAGEIVVGELAGRLIDHVAQLEPLGELELKGKQEPVRAYRLVEIAPVAPAFARKLDAPLAGRRKELGRLRKALRTAKTEERPRAVTVIGPPGIGKSRLAAEIAGRAKSVTALFGRCLAYGEGITYWPVREVVESAPQSDESDALLDALEADTPPPAPEIALLFRRFCETVARERPLVLVLDDVHWAERTFLELVEHLVDRGSGPMLVLCLAREELDEERPGFLADRPNAERIAVNALSADETDALLESLGGVTLETDQRARLVATAEGNPLFLEQLLALALEGGLALGERALPETIQALLAARLDRLGPGERAVLERGSIVLRGFTREDVAALVDPDAAPTLDAHLLTLVARGFVRPLGDAEFAFRHVLVQEAVYRSAPKRLRAELHERFADHLERTAPHLVELDEFVGYHLEQACALRTELGEADRHLARMAEDGGRHLGAAGTRAFIRGDLTAGSSLTRRATSLLPLGETYRRELLVDLAIGEYASDDVGGATELLSHVIAESEEAGDRRIELWARMELAYIRLRSEPGKTADELLAVTAESIPVFESVDDQRRLGRAWLFDGWVRGGRRCDHRGWEDGAQRAIQHYKAAGWSTSVAIGELGAALYWGPTHVEDAIARCEVLLREESLSRLIGSYLNTFLGGLAAQRGLFSRGRALVDSARETMEALGLTSAATYFPIVLSEIELLQDRPRAAEQVLRANCEALERSRHLSRLASAASELANALTLLGSFDEAYEWTDVAEENTAPDDLHARMRWFPVRARILAQRGALRAAEDLAREGVRLAEMSDDMNERANAHRALAHVLRVRGSNEAARSALIDAHTAYERKGNVVGLARVREQLEAPILA